MAYHLPVGDLEKFLALDTFTRRLIYMALEELLEHRNELSPGGPKAERFE